ncbi:nucleotide-binding universal stress UspA family protein [Bradyrhizobium diazoefficiens]|jgi:nucleotide-binding universal stress UspA family protein|uniref:universal stress protein n=1 Tax=Bradyrhizobium TaxID=374 RepID=UPI000765E96A|nr:universal stress protein [Bradyrhizobium diazoefficiens]MBR0865111.1 universal stress protein [Bradyrhizobium diazoefficiens]MBR0889645.1 universal stress protein [Bradyrhizobium diazoefficiens]MBR0921352.1 universal stress protein [Bradyrhizobium diazoefficiens]WLA60930.1 universal stress protein [Bradyrhizobium diazoefficiens]
MIKDILVHIPTERPPQPVIDASTSLAGALHAHLDAIAAGYIQPGIAFAADGVVTGVATVFEMEQERATERSAAALAVFETEARKAEIPYGCRSIQDLPAEAASAVGAAARLYDLTVVLQPDTAQDSFDNATSTQILLQAGGPVLVIPHIFKGAFRPRRIGICWDGSRSAARAVKDAKPLLSGAEAVVVISINEVQVAPAEASAQNLMKHMGRSEIATTLIELTAERSEVQPSILSLAADEGLDMLVMGAYGHSRIREGLFGGVTREMLNTMTVPALMSH